MSTIIITSEVVIVPTVSSYSPSTVVVFITAITTPASTSSYYTSPTSSTAATTPIVTASDTTRPSHTPSPGLSIGAKLGIGISIPLAVVAIAFGIAFFFHRRHKRANSTPGSGDTETTYANLADKPLPLVAELQGHSTVPSWRAPDARPVIHELPGTPPTATGYYRPNSASSSVHELRQVDAAQKPDARELQRQASLAASEHVPHELSASGSRQATNVPPLPTGSPTVAPDPLVSSTVQPSRSHNTTPPPTASEITDHPRRPTSPIDDNASVHVSRHASAIASRTTNDDAELAQIEEAMTRLRNQKKLLQELRDVERQEADMERRRKELRMARDRGGGGLGD
ncbi:hypothetical protein BU16DRAFT_558243 [Lophium mytilinum]|uniref:Mid2 domain-containing protein n=1 Tax=Lophium mytilinum TaxID=390894 RepID=A0A6A6R1C0_9PEZI|nr:hypothetical protein BU16DRAFT_558243 [Lophium mytilinum]